MYLTIRFLMLKIRPVLTIPDSAGFARIILMFLLFSNLALYLFISSKIIWILYLLYLLLLILLRMKITVRPILIPALLTAPLLTALPMSLTSDIYHFTQGFFYLSIPVILLITGYQLARIYPPVIFLSFLVKSGILMAIVFIIFTVSRVGFIAFLSPYTEARFSVASGSVVCVLSLIIAAYSEYFDFKIFKRSSLKYLSIFVNLIAIYLFASRTYWILLFIFVLLFSIKTMRKDKLLFYGFLLIGGFLILTSVVDSKSDLTFQNSIIYKLVNSFREIRIRDLSDYGEINTYYRGYEAYRGWVTFTEGNVIEKIFGFGYGKLVNLNASVFLDGKYWTAVPWIHNGFFFILVKEGLLGILLSLLFFIYLLKISIRGFTFSDSGKQFFYLILLGCSFSMFITNFVVCAMFSHEMAILMITIGYILSLSSEKTKGNGVPTDKS